MQKRGFFASKKGTEDIYTTLIDLVLIAVVVSVLFFFFFDVFRNTYFEKSYLARDLALTAESVQGSGRVYHRYEQSGLDKYHLDFQKNRVSVGTKAAQEMPAYYPYYANQLGKNQLMRIEGKGSFYISGCDGSVLINPVLMACPNICIDADPGRKTSLVVVPMQAAMGNLENAVMARYAAELSGYIVRSQLVFADAQIWKEGMQAKPDVALTIAATSSDSEYVKVFFKPGNRQSESMACHIVNSIKQKYPQLAASSLPRKQRQEAESPLTIEIGVTQAEGVPRFKDAAEMSAAIMKGMGEHFG